MLIACQAKLAQTQNRTMPNKSSSNSAAVAALDNPSEACGASRHDYPGKAPDITSDNKQLSRTYSSGRRHSCCCSNGNIIVVMCRSFQLGYRLIGPQVSETQTT